MGLQLERAEKPLLRDTVVISDIVMRPSRRKRPSVQAGGRLRIRLTIAGKAVDSEYRAFCKTPEAVEYVRERLAALMRELDGVRVE